MTFYLPTGVTETSVYSNLPNVYGEHTLTITSQYNKNVWTFTLYPQITNDRYTKFTTSISSEDRVGHFNGIYNFTITNDVFEVVETGLLKWINEEGGSNDTVEYISNNENREAEQYYRPQY